MKPGDWKAPLRFLEWGFLLIATIFLTTSATYRPFMSLGMGILVGSNLARWARIRRFSRPTPIDLGILIFLASLLVAHSVAPDPAEATHRLFLYLTGISLFYSIVNSRSLTLHYVALFFALTAAGAVVVFISQNQWAGLPTRFSMTRVVGASINHLIPDLGLPQPHWNVVRNWLASLIGILLPIAVFFGFKGYRRRNKFRTAPSASATSIGINLLGAFALLIGLLFTESRAPWLVWFSLAAVLGWWMVASHLGARFKVSALTIFWTCLGVVIGLGFFTLILQPELRAFLELIPGPNTAVAREEIYAQSWLLAQDTPFTGGGLAAFPALYSTYIRALPYNVFLNEDTGNNLYLNLLVEQGWIGLLSFIGIFLTGILVASARLKKVKRPYRRFVLVGIFGAGYILLQGLIHATFIATRIIPFFLAPLGMALAGVEKRGATLKDAPFSIWKTQIISLLVLSTPLVITLIRSPASTMAAWYANIGAVQLARSDLADFPAEQWDDGTRAVVALPGEALLTQALLIDPTNRTAHHRLGLIAMLRRDFNASDDHLAMALKQQPLHRGVRKNLGYSYAWMGNYERAIPLLSSLPEIREEITVYQWWWESQDRHVLSDRAALTAEALDRYSN